MTLLVLKFVAVKIDSKGFAYGCVAKAFAPRIDRLFEPKGCNSLQNGKGLGRGDLRDDKWVWKVAAPFEMYVTAIEERLWFKGQGQEVIGDRAYEFG